MVGRLNAVQGLALPHITTNVGDKIVEKVRLYSFEMIIVPNRFDNTSSILSVFMRLHHRQARYVD